MAVQVFIEMSVPVRWRRRDTASEDDGFFYDARRGIGKAGRGAGREGRRTGYK